ncbi:hypothetical protein D3C80_1571020 [compost metagenome]
MAQTGTLQDQAIVMALLQHTIKNVDRADKFSAETAVRMLVDLFRFADLYKFATVHDGNAPCHGHRLFLVMGDHYAGHANPLKNIRHFQLHAVTQFFIQCAHRLIQQQQFRPFGQAACQCHPLALATG